MSTKRTAKDEYQYDVQLRREHGVMREVITHLRESHRTLLENQQRLLQNLLHADAALRVYREQTLATTVERLHTGAQHCVPGCTKHTWDTTHGWCPLVVGVAKEDVCTLTLAK